MVLLVCEFARYYSQAICRNNVFTLVVQETRNALKSAITTSYHDIKNLLCYIASTDLIDCGTILDKVGQTTLAFTVLLRFILGGK